STTTLSTPTTPTQSAFKKAKSNPRDTPSQTHILTLNPKVYAEISKHPNAIFGNIYHCGHLDARINESSSSEAELFAGNS
ncbi:hypothetical protein, partial [Mobiluncus mulieris]|uniref:hypothetical protein n=1 Tax=Mobiluncus mulieris TaxID=2052 RepID=UPI001B8C3D8B